MRLKLVRRILYGSEFPADHGHDITNKMIVIQRQSSKLEHEVTRRMKHAMVIPGLKKAGLDQNDLGNYRPISNLSFLSKLLERCAYEQITEYLHENDLMPEKQSVYRTHHSTETALLDVLSGRVLLSMQVRSLCLACSISAPPLIPLIRAFSSKGCDIAMELLETSWAGWQLIWRAERRQSISMVNFQRQRWWPVVFHRAAYWAR